MPHFPVLLTKFMRRPLPKLEKGLAAKGQAPLAQDVCRQPKASLMEAA